jgi:hypothetical protein
LLQIILIVGVITIGFYLGRRWHIRRLRAQVRGKVPLTEEIKQTVARLFSSDVLEVAAVGAVTYVDIAWHYSLADPQIWSHLDGGVASHAFDAMVDPQVLQAGLGAHSSVVLDQVADYLQQADAVSAFDHSLDSVMRLGVDLPDAALVLDGHPDMLFDYLSQKGQVAGAAVDAKSQALADGVTDGLPDAKASALVEAKPAALLDAKAGALLDAKANALIESKTAAALDADLLHHIPFITIGFAAFRAWRRAEEGTTWGRNLEFAATEVVARAGGALTGAKVGGTVGTLVVPGYGTIVGSVVGAVGGAIAGAKLSEEIKRRHVRQAQRKLDVALNNLGAPHLQDPVGYRRLQAAFYEQEKMARRNAARTQREYSAYARWWRRLWPDQKLILLQETVRGADDRLENIHQQVRDTLDRVEALRRRDDYKALGLVLWNAPGMCQQLGCAELLVQDVRLANEHLRHELQQVGAVPV